MNTAEYLIKQLENLGINHIFGVPGDYNFNIIYAVQNNSGTEWINCTNELNAGYAADGYARIKGYGAIVTTYGVGELSAMNAIAGSYAENVPVIHIVGVPQSQIIESNSPVHHSFNNPKPYAFSEAFEKIVETKAFLNRDNTKLEIDRVLKTFVKERKPVYIAIPMDIATTEISDKSVNYDWISNQENLQTVIEKIADKINKSTTPVILGDILIKRFDALLEYREFIEQSGIPAGNLLMGKDLLNDKLPNSLGTYYSQFGNNVLAERVKNTDCLISVGTIYSDLNSFGINLLETSNSHVAIYGTYTYVNGKRYDNIKMSEVLDGLTKKIEQRKFEFSKEDNGYDKVNVTKEKLTSKFLYPRIQEYLTSNDIVIADTGTLIHGLSKIKLPENVEFISQSLWCSIGWATPAAFGASLANPKRRVVIITGDGALQMTGMEIGNMFKHKLNPVIILLNNSGYTIERLLSNDKENSFNDIIKMDYTRFVRAFDGEIWAGKAETDDDFDKALRVTQIMNRLCFIEAVLDKNDVSDFTNDMINASKEAEKSIPKTKTQPKIELPKFELAEEINYSTQVHTSLKEIDEE